MTTDMEAVTAAEVAAPASGLTRLTRVFKYGALRLVDPGSEFTPDEVRELYSVNFPGLAVSEVVDGQVVNGELIYEFTEATVKTKG